MGTTRALRSHGHRGLGLAALFLFCAQACSSDPDPDPPGRDAGLDTGTKIDAQPESDAGADALSDSDAGADGGLRRAIAGQVSRYDYAVDLVSRSVRSTLAIHVEPPGGECFSSACQVTVSNTKWNGGPPVSSERSEDALLVCGASVAGGEALELSAEALVPEQTFLGLDVGFSRKKDLAGGTFSYLLSWVEGCSHFGPCDANPARLAEFHFDVAHAPGEVVLCPGKLTPGETRTRCDLSPGDLSGDAGAGSLGPTYSTVAVASDSKWVRAPFLTAAGVDIVSYEVPGGQIAATLDKESVGRFFEWITDLLGPFPYGNELRFAGAPTFWSGFEHPANILLNEKLPERTTPYAKTTMHVLMHEIAHQWAGDRVTLAEVGDFVWKEATVEYLTYAFEEKHRPLGEADVTRAYWDRISLQATHHPRPIDDPLPAVQDFYRSVYGPGPMVLYLQLEDLIGKDTVRKAIRSFLAQPGTRSVNALRRELEAASQKDLSAYFNAWVYGKGKPAWPMLTASTSQQGENVAVVVTQETEDAGGNKLYGCVVEVEVETTSGGKYLARVDFGLNPSSASETARIALPAGELVKAYRIDPRHRVINRDRNVDGGSLGAMPTEEEILIF